MDKRKNYLPADVEVIRFDASDVITTSESTWGEKNYDNSGWT